ncbi:MAG: adenylate/guanylate cyclase domain-containing protein [Planctomycetaceae bacterium]|jgi:adenylate cyclase|nr:adenylate/guanylate cyclase domain-containing protein [Planctomycetaceae bacterium]MBT6153465.1 adenylate/guanylate cyclase domain-containing protein [Planctomycetaceae bacterium]MBT6484703.1 adenylate/guanylate cyclase domain-containing protein [Planctomycetaceae bacterium]MBT6496453.1 adenylate/guanylate cyclase domain-containing protein [Planctomycetaceae bacterium]
MAENQIGDAGDRAFEQIRQQQETRNEIIINYLQMLHFGVVLVANLLTHVLPVAPYRAGVLLLGFLATSLFARFVIFFYLRSKPAYSRWRKYLISAFDLVIFTASPLLLARQDAYPWLFLSVFSVCIYTMLIVLAGLRYSRQVVVFNGVATALLHASLFALPTEAGYRLPVLVVGLLTLGITTLCIAYCVESLIRIHREAAIKEQLARFLPPELVEQVSRQPDLLDRTTQRREATVIFTDIRGFTRFSEQLPAEQVVEFLNAFLEEMTSAIMDHQGMLDKYIGDAVMGVFGVPVIHGDHPQRALKAAIDMRERLHALNHKLEQQGLPALSIGIGLHTGELLIGAIGSTRRLDYTVIGDTVNVASRIEGMTRSYPVEILLSDSTRAAIADDVTLHEIATVTVKNRDEPITIWSPDPPVDKN